MISDGVLLDHGDCFGVSLLLNRYLGTAFVSVDVWYLPNGSPHHALAGLGALFRANFKYQPSLQPHCGCRWCFNWITSKLNENLQQQTVS